jgi:hypothetical protein
MKTTNRRMRREFLTVATAAWVLLAGCSVINGFKFQEDTEKLCTNGKDDDGDGAMDCIDSECWRFIPCMEKQHGDDSIPWNDNYCSDGVDNDGDTLVDCDDKDEGAGEYSCIYHPYCTEDTYEECHDTNDNDRDGDIDCKDSDCDAFCVENSLELCSNMIDDDQDGAVDCQDANCGETGACSGEDFHLDRCRDGVDNDQDTYTDCEDPECQYLLPDCPPTAFREVMTDDFQRADIGGWNVYDYRSIRDPQQEHVTRVDGNALHVRVAIEGGTTLPPAVREEAGVVSMQAVETWGNVTDIGFRMKVAPPLAAPPDVVVPAAAGIVLDSTAEKPFMELADPSGADAVIAGRHAVLALRVDWKGGVQLCARGPDDVSMDCVPRDGAVLPTTPPDDNGFFTYGLALTDRFIAVSLNGGEIFRVENLADAGVPRYLPGIGRLFFVGSTDAVGSMYASEFWVDDVVVLQAYEQDAISTKGYDSSVDAGTLEATNPGNCSFDSGNVLRSTWVSDAEEDCSVVIPTAIDPASRLQMSYVTSATSDDSAYFLPGLWSATPDFDLSLPLAAGFMGAEAMNMLVFRPCVPARLETGALGFVNAGYAVRVVAGHDPDASFSYAVFQNEDGASDVASAVAYDSACYDLQRFGLTSRNCTVCALSSATGTVQSVEVMSFGTTFEER